MPNELNMPISSSSCANFVRPPKPLQVTGCVAENWKNWIQQYEWFAIAAEMEGKTPEVQVAAFMTSIGADVLNIYNSFSSHPRKGKMSKQSNVNSKTILPQKQMSHLNDIYSTLCTKKTVNHLMTFWRRSKTKHKNVYLVHLRIRLFVTELLLALKTIQWERSYCLWKTYR